jgi:hypothetical protein
VYDLIKKKSPLPLFILAYITTVILFIDITDLAVMSRYYVPMIPFFLLFTVYGTWRITEWLANRYAPLRTLWHYVFFLVIFLVALVGFKTVNVGILISKQAVPQAFSNYLSMAKWTQTNIPAGEVIGARKDSIYYLMSGHPSTMYYYQGDKFTRYSSFSDELEKLSMQKFKNWKMSYMVFDTFSGDALGKLLPIMRHYPQKFSTVYAFASANQAVQLPDKWWMNDGLVSQLITYGGAILIKYDYN